MAQQMMRTSTDRLAWGIVAHLVADWLLQNDWMARHKSTVRHPAGIVHALIHAAALRLVFPLRWALMLGVLHYLVDLRFLLAWWRRLFRQTTQGDVGLHVAIWGDQVVHIMLIALVALVTGQNGKRR